jgi:hypothetical protein
MKCGGLIPDSLLLLDSKYVLGTCVVAVKSWCKEHQKEGSATRSTPNSMELEEILPLILINNLILPKKVVITKLQLLKNLSTASNKGRLLESPALT